MVDLNVRSKRLLRELREIEVCPLPNINVHPVGDSTSEWHGNIRGDVSSPHWANIVLHFKIVIPTSYPVNPPRVILFSFFPHINVIQRRGEWEVCLDMLETQDYGHGSQLTMKYRYWSSGYTIRSILIQLSSFLLVDHQPTSSAAGGIERVLRETREFRCPHEGCDHNSETPVPGFASDENIQSAPFSYPCINISGDLASSRLAICAETFTDLTDEESVATASHDTPTCPPQKENASPTTENDWTVVEKKGRHSNPKSSSDAVKDNSLNLKESGNKNLYSVIEESDFAKCDICGAWLPKSSFSKSCWKLLGKQVSSVICLNCQKSRQESLTHPSAVATKNFLRREKKRELKTQSECGSADQDVHILGSEQNSDCVSVTSIKSSAVSINPAELTSIKGAGKLAKLPRDVVIGSGDNSRTTASGNGTSFNGICSFLSVSDVLNLGQTCKSLHSQLDGDWLLWRSLFMRRFGKNSALAPNGTHASELKYAWKYAYLLEANRLTDDLQCFHTLQTSSDSGVILGIPIDYTINPKTGQLDYVTSTFDIISFSAYSTYGIRRTLWGEKFLSFIPLYIDEEHFMRSINRLLTVGANLMTPKPVDIQSKKYFDSKMSSRRNASDNWRKPVVPELEDLWTPQSPPEMAMALLVKLMNTQVVLLCDNGIEASENALTGYCQLHRLLLALSRKFPQLRKKADKRIAAFIQNPERRVKRYTPSLGDLICMLTISERYQWGDIALPYLFESFDRAVLWSCSKDISLLNLPTGDKSRLEKFLAAHSVGLRLCLFHAVFLRLLLYTGVTTGNRLRECEARYDIFLGRPPLQTKRRWHSAVRSILQFSSWPEFFSIGGFPKIPSPQQLVETLESSIKNSLKKGYHSANTKFENVMKSGVSRILLKGNSYTVDPGIKQLKLSERWRFDGETIFLDASCLLFDFNGALVGVVDYNHLSWSSRDARAYRDSGIPYQNSREMPGREAPVRHSGDVINNGVGQHTIDIDLAKLPQNVCCLLFTVSSWTTSLVEIRQPSAHLFDVVADSELCSYQFEDVDTGENTAVMMCKLQRPYPGGRWAMTSIGHVGLGRADHYHAILEDVIKHKVLEISPKDKKEETSAQGSA